MPTPTYIMKTINVTFTGTNGNEQPVFDDSVIGEEGENRATKLSITLPTAWADFIGTDAYISVCYLNAKGRGGRSANISFPALIATPIEYEIPFDALYAPETVFWFVVFDTIGATTENRVTKTKIYRATVNTGYDTGTVTAPFGNDIIQQLMDDIETRMKLDGSNSNVDKLSFDITPTTDTLTEGQMRWNATDGTLDLAHANAVQQIGQELFIKVINKTASTITNGSAVYFNGRQGNRPKIELAKGDADATSAVMGLCTEDIASNAEGFITTFGYVRQIKTNYSTWAEGQPLYVSTTTAGVLTNVEPTAPHHSDIVGCIGVVGAAGVGSIFVLIDRHRTMQELADVNGTALTESGQIPVWNNTTKVFDFTDNINNKVEKNEAITGATKTKITYDEKGLVTSGADATTADIADSTDKRYCTDAQKTVIGNTSNTNSGDSTINTSHSAIILADNTDLDTIVPPTYEHGIYIIKNPTGTASLNYPSGSYDGRTVIIELLRSSASAFYQRISHQTLSITSKYVRLYGTSFGAWVLRGVASENITGLEVNSSNGNLELTTGYVIPSSSDITDLTDGGDTTLHTHDSKVNVSDIVNDLTTGGTTVPLSAEQGKTLQTDKLSATVTSPVLDEVIRYNGSEWVNGQAVTASASAGIEFFPDTTKIITKTAENAFAVETLNKFPVTTAETVDAIACTNNTVLNSAYLYDTALGRTSIDAGTWQFDFYASVSSTSSGRVSTLTKQIYKVSPYTSTNVSITGTGTSRTCTASGGTPFAVTNINASATNTVASFVMTPKGLYQITARTSDTVVTISTPSAYTNESTVAFSVWKKLFGATTPTITALNTNYQLYTTISVQSAFTVAVTDKLGKIMFGTSNNTTTVNYVYNGTTRYSHFSTPLITMHNNLAGLQGGASNDYYHLTDTEKTAALNGLQKTTNITSIDDTGIADGEIMVANLTAKKIETSNKTIVTTLGTTDDTVPTSKAVKDVTDLRALKTWGAPFELTLLNGWTGNLYVRKNDLGIIEIYTTNLAVGTGVAGTIIATLPTTYASGSRYVVFSVYNSTSGAVSGFFIDTNRDLKNSTIHTTGYGIRFGHTYSV